ncbi:hypothetical protein [Accumulibacter sp.]|uniref:hypothetical protein n=1 Tax=Accumulibacter sp. TaxID=2053492 RepID=UPI0025FE5D2F|nr:hypothetical protein [Accumulibacter sp.]MCM8594984.1 hypothetical protein [Accumulibacter sp.]MCM8625623.1 hypothetical protein [Accumulibacter sp.]MDS4049130.1 hypothetical protein [Accumulibacter sp.]
MNREELRDQLLAPVLAWTRLGRQTSALIVASMEVIGSRSSTLIRANTLRGSHDWPEMCTMTSEKLTVPLQAMLAMASAMQTETRQFLAEAGEAAAALASGAVGMTASGGAGEERGAPADLGHLLISSALVWYQLWGRAAEVLEQGLQPILRQVQSNADRLSP